MDIQSSDKGELKMKIKPKYLASGILGGIIGFFLLAILIGTEGFNKIFGTSQHTFQTTMVFTLSSVGIALLLTYLYGKK